MNTQNRQQNTEFDIPNDNRNIRKIKSLKCSNNNLDTKLALLSGGLLLFSILSLFSCSYCVYLDEYSSNHVQHTINLLLMCIIEIIIATQNLFNRITKKKIVHIPVEIDILFLIIGLSALFYSIYKRNDILLDFIVPVNIISLILSIYYLKMSLGLKRKKINQNKMNRMRQ